MLFSVCPLHNIFKKIGRGGGSFGRGVCSKYIYNVCPVTVFAVQA